MLRGRGAAPAPIRSSDIDRTVASLLVRAGKGIAAWTIELEKGIRALKTWLALRDAAPSDQLFLNCDGDHFKEWGPGDLLAKYYLQAGITKKITPHSPAPYFASYKAERGVSPIQRKEWLGHTRLDTTSISVHLASQNAQKVMEVTSL